MAQIFQRYLAYSPIVDELAGLPDALRKLALDHFRLLQLHIEEHRPLRSVADEAGIPYRTAQRWLSRYQQSGLAALVRKSRADAGERRALSARLREAIEGLALQKPPLPVAAIHREAQRLARNLGEKTLSYGTVFNIVRRLPADLVMLAHEGTSSYNQMFELLHRREAATPNEIWQADHTPLDVLLLAPDGEAAKPWLTVVLDDYSRAAAGYFLSFDPPSVLHTALALRQAIWRKGDPRWHVCGIPDALYTDHGSDFTSHHLEQVAADLKMRLVFSIPGKPRGRGRIERFFSTLNEMFLCELEGYAPPSGGVRGKPALSLAEFESRFRNFLLDAYHRRECEETKTPPMERWEANGFLPRMPESLEQLDLLLIHVAKTRQVRRDGIRFQGLRYMSTDLAAYIGESVTLRIDPRDLGEVRVFYKERFLCRAICAELAGAAVPLKEIIRARNGRRSELRAILRDRQQAVDALLEIRRGEVTETKDATDRKPPSTGREPAPALKRYRNE
jgi:putative transposase